MALVESGPCDVVLDEWDFGHGVVYILGDSSGNWNGWYYAETKPCADAEEVSDA